MMGGKGIGRISRHAADTVGNVVRFGASIYGYTSQEGIR